MFTCAPLQPSPRKHQKAALKETKLKKAIRGTGMSPAEMAACLKIEDDIYCHAQWCFSAPQHLSLPTCYPYL
jgi:hypothetical protein